MVVRVTCRPASVTVPEADTTEVPVTLEVSVIVQLPVAPTVRHGLRVVNEPGPETFVNVIGVPSGAFTKPAPSPAFTFMCAVNTWVVFDRVERRLRRDLDVRVDVRLDRVGRVEARAVGLDGERRRRVPIDSVADAWPVTLPAVGEVKVIVHWPFASVFAPAACSVPVGAVCAAPFVSVSVTVTCSSAAGTKGPCRCP